MTKTESLANLADEMTAYSARPVSKDTLAGVLYSAIKVLVSDNRFEDEGERLLRAADAAFHAANSAGTRS